MGIFRKRDELHKALAAARPAPRDEFVSELAARVAPRAPRRRYSRVAFAMALTTFMAGSFATFGGIGYAASGLAGTVHTVKTVVHVRPAQHRTILSSAYDQYHHKKIVTAPKTKAVHHVRKTHVSAVHTAPLHQAVKQRSLPFTGLSLVGTVALSLLLIGVGAILRRVERRTE
jgi:hypothetical protein